MNAGGVDRACKSCGFVSAREQGSGKHVGTYPRDGDNPAKAGLIPDSLARVKKQFAWGEACGLSASW
jgi:hypothetical protein